MSAQYDDISVSFYEVRYSLKQLQDLRAELKNQSMSIAYGVKVFMSYVESNNGIFFWVDWADKIKMDEDSPEKHFAEPEQQKTSFTLFPKG